MVRFGEYVEPLQFPLTKQNNPVYLEMQITFAHTFLLMRTSFVQKVQRTVLDKMLIHPLFLLKQKAGKSLLFVFY